jgi:hypothetical protein
MRLLMTSVVALAGIVIGASAASACEWHQQVMASAAPPAPPAATEQSQAAPATQVDPAMIAYLDQLAKDAAAAPATSQDAQPK